jgi:hypothetical protein
VGLPTAEPPPSARSLRGELPVSVLSDALLRFDFDDPTGETLRELLPGEPLSQSQCMRLLQPGGAGRLICGVFQNLVTLHVDFKMVNGNIYLLSCDDAVVSRLLTQDPVTLAFCGAINSLHAGWSVLAKGTLTQVEDPHVLFRIEALDMVEPLISGEHDACFQLLVDSLDGSRVESSQ